LDTSSGDSSGTPSSLRFDAGGRLGGERGKPGRTGRGTGEKDGRLPGKEQSPMIEILQTIALLVWIAVGVYTFRSVRRINRRMDLLIAGMERDVQNTWR